MFSRTPWQKIVSFSKFFLRIFSQKKRLNWPKTLTFLKIVFLGLMFQNSWISARIPRRKKIFPDFFLEVLKNLSSKNYGFLWTFYNCPSVQNHGFFRKPLWKISYPKIDVFQIILQILSFSRTKIIIGLEYFLQGFFKKKIVDFCKILFRKFYEFYCEVFLSKCLWFSWNLWFWPAIHENFYFRN